MSENVQYEMLEGLINSLAKRIDKFDIVDGSFNDIYKKASFPQWFVDAIE